MKTNRFLLAVYIWAAVFSFSLLLNVLLNHLDTAGALFVVVRTLIVISLLVPYTVFGAVPRINRWLTPPHL